MSNRQKECVRMPGKMARSDPRPGVRVTRGAGSNQHLASVLQEGRENANIDAGLGFIWRISVATTSPPRFFSFGCGGRRGYGIFGLVLEIGTGRAGWTKAINERNPKHIYWMSFRQTISSIQRLGH